MPGVAFDAARPAPGLRRRLLRPPAAAAARRRRRASPARSTLQVVDARARGAARPRRRRRRHRTRLRSRDDRRAPSARSRRASAADDTAARTRARSSRSPPRSRSRSTRRSRRPRRAVLAPDARAATSASPPTLDRRLRRAGLRRRDGRAASAAASSSRATARSACRRPACCCARPASPLIALAPARRRPRCSSLRRVVIGLGYGPITPASSQVLARTTPPARMALTFSIKQTGVPAGAALAGAVLPALALAVGWRARVPRRRGRRASSSRVAAQPTRRALDADRSPDRAVLAGRRPRAAAARAAARRAARAVARRVRLRGGAGVPVELPRRLPDARRCGWSLVAAGFALTVRDARRRRRAHRLGRGRRPAVGAARVLGADRRRRRRCAALAHGASRAGWPTLARARGRGGVRRHRHRLERRAARRGRAPRAARHRPAPVTGASGFITFGGVVLGPPPFAAARGRDRQLPRRLRWRARRQLALRLRPCCCCDNGDRRVWKRFPSGGTSARAHAAAQAAHSNHRGRRRPDRGSGATVEEACAWTTDARPRSAGNAGMARRARRRARARRAGPRALPDRAADRRGAPLRRLPAVLGQHRVHQHDPGRRAGAHPGRLRDRAAHPLTTCAGTRWRWCCARTSTPTSAATSRASRRRRRSTTSASTTSGTRRPTTHGGDLVFVQGHSAPGVYARAFMLGRLTDEQLDNFRQEVDGKGISSYPHPWLMPDFWQFPTVSMGLGPADGDLPGALHEVPAGPRPRADRGPQGLGVHGRRRDGRAGVDGRHRHGRRARTSTT